MAEQDRAPKSLAKASGARQDVCRRKVFYIPGYDPIHPRRYRELFRKEGAAQAKISGYELSLSAKSGGDLYGWRVSSTFEGRETTADVTVLVWSDIVRNSMSNTILATYGQLLRTAWEYIATGALFRLMRLRKGPVIAALYPIGALLLQLLLAVAVVAVATYVGGFFGSVGQGFGAFAGLAAGIFLLRWFKAKDGKFFAYYLMHDYAYSARFRGANRLRNLRSGNCREGLSHRAVPI